jgi:predicted HAD superfamily hydrolase
MANGIDKLIFISRDGAIYQKVYEILFPEEKTDYLYWSRIFCAKVTADHDKYDFLLRIINHRKNDIYPLTIEDVFSLLKLRGLENALSAYGLNKADIIVESNSNQVQNFFIDYWDNIIGQLNENEKSTQLYLEKYFSKCKHAAIVDIGWQGSGLFGIKWLVEDKFKFGCKVDCLLAGSKALSLTGNLTQEMNYKFHTYLFSRMYNRDMFDFFAHENNHTNTGHFELFTQAQAPTFSGLSVKNNGELKFEFGIPEVENHSKISEIHKGIIDYSILYKKIFSDYPFLFNVSGYDAIQPFRHISKNLTFIEEQLGDFVFSRNICENFKKPYLETIKEVMVKQGVSTEA